MSRTWMVAPGVPAAGHVSGGAWHPGKPDGCAKCVTFGEPIVAGFGVWSRTERPRRSEWAQVDHALDRAVADAKAQAIRDRWDRDGIVGDVEVRPNR